VNFLQWGMTLYSSDADVVVSPMVMVVLGTLCLVFAMGALVIDILLPDCEERCRVAVSVEVQTEGTSMTSPHS